MRLCISTFLFICFFFSVNAQDSGVFVLQWDKPYYSTGELLYYSLQLPEEIYNNEISIQVNVTDATSGESQSIFYIQSSKQKNVNGYYEIPINCKTGLYNVNFSIADSGKKIMERVAYANVHVFNGFEEGIGKDIFSLEDINQEDSEFVIDVDYDSINGGQSKVNTTMNITIKDKENNPVQASYSISIIDKNLVYGSSDDTVVPCAIFSNGSIVDPSDKISFKGISSQVATESAEGKVFGVYNSNSDEFSFARSFDDGSFIIELDDFGGSQSFQLLDYNMNGTSIKQSYFNSMTSDIDSRSVSISASNIDGYLQRDQEIRKINQYFDITPAIDKGMSDDRSSGEVEEKKASASFNFREYQDFKSLGSFFQEILTSLKYDKEEDGIFTAKLTDPSYRGLNKFYFDDTPVFIVDGELTKDADLVGNLDFDKVELVEIYHDPKILKAYYGLMGRCGVVKVTTSLPDFSVGKEASTITLQGFQASANWADINTSESYDKLTPVFRSTIYWNPSVVSDSQGLSRVTFQESNNQGNYLITIVAISQDGRVGYHQVTR